MTSVPQPPGRPTLFRGKFCRALMRYMMVIAVGNTIWEVAQLPLYTLWSTERSGGIAYALLHCTIGDLMIAFLTLTTSLIAVRAWRWPGDRWLAVALLSVMFAVGYTVFSEWLNVEIRKSWAYSELMPIVPILGVGLSPILQWIVVPLLAHFSVWRGGPANRTEPS